MATESNKTAVEGGDVHHANPRGSREQLASLSPSNKLTKKESLRIQKQTYKLEKKKAENEFKMIAQDPAVVILSDWLKVRNNLKKWSRMWCVLNPGMLIFFKNSKQKSWIGTVLLASVEIIERPSKKQGMCFKIYHILNQSIWASKGPKGENSGLLANSLPGNHVILRAQTESDGQCWVDALELAKNCSNLLKKSLNSSVKRKSAAIKDKVARENLEAQSKSLLDKLDFSIGSNPASNDRQEKRENSDDIAQNTLNISIPKVSVSISTQSEENISSSTKSMKENLLEYPSNQDPYATSSAESFESDDAFTGDESAVSASSMVPSTLYVLDENEELGDAVDNTQTEELEGENKSLVWMLLKQVKPGMDLSKVVLPTFILEPRSFLDKLSDYYYHADLLGKASLEKNAYSRMKIIAKWYLSGFYKKPKGLKKPYNPILGEIFRCKWEHPDSSSTFYIAEQVSHHPPISAIAVINRKAGFTVHGSILAKSKFYGNSLSAILDGNLTVSLLNLGEEYVVTLPYAHCKGILYGKMTMEFGGKVRIKCEKTGYVTEIEFKLKGIFGRTMNEVAGRILLGQRVLGTLSGAWDQAVHLTDLNKGSVEEFWAVTQDIKASRLQRYVVNLSQQGEFESANLWRNVAAAIKNKNQVAATEEKTKLEVEQRKGAKQRKENNEVWVPRYFDYNIDKDEWEYKHMDARPWDSLNDIEQVESEGIISTKTKHKTTPVRRGFSRGSILSHRSLRHSSTPSNGKYYNKHLRYLAVYLIQKLSLL